MIFRTKIFWDSEKFIGTVNSPKGNIWNTIGVFQSGKALIHADEALFLTDVHGFELFQKCSVLSSPKKINSLTEIWTIINSDCGLNSHKVLTFASFASIMFLFLVV